MTPLDEPPEQRWRRTVDRRNRPAKLKVDRLLRDFGYTELDAAVGDAIEARLAGVALAVAPSLRDANANEIVTIYADESATAPEEPAPDAPVADPPAAAEPAGASDVAQMVTYLKQQVLDARTEADRLRGELDRRIASRADSDAEAQTIIAEQAAALEEQSRQIAELGDALNHTRQALAETRDEIRRAVGELQAMPEPPPIPAEDPAGEDDEPSAEDSLSGEEWADGREEAEAAAAAPDEPLRAEAEAFEAPAPSGDGELAAATFVDDVAEPATAPPPEPDDESAADAVETQPEDLASPVQPDDAEAGEPALERDEPPRAAPEPAPDDGTAFDLDLDEPPLGVPEPAREDELPGFDLDDDLAEWQPRVTAQQPDPEFDVPRQEADELDEFDVQTSAAGAAAQVDAPVDAEDAFGGFDEANDHEDTFGGFDDADDHDEELAAQQPAATGDAGIDDDLLTGFDDFLYDADELYDPRPGGDAAEDEEADAFGYDEAATALPPPPPAPPSPWADDLEPEVPVVVERPTLGKVLRNRGRGRGRWHGSCSICGREPAENKRKDLEAAGWDLDDETPVCPQCRGIG